MVEIGASLREARTRARIEIAEMEAQTKIRAKYLRALENEEWELLPGPTYIKSFLKTYGDQLGLDGRRLVAEYKARHELADLAAAAPPLTGGRISPSDGGGAWRWAVAAAIAAALAAAGYFALAAGGPGDGERAAGGDAAPVERPGGDADPVPAGDEPTDAEPSDPVTVRVTARADVFVCARAGERRLEPGRTLREGQRTGRLRGRELLLTVADARAATVRVDGEPADLGAGEGPVTVRIVKGRVQAAPPEQTACRG